MAAMRSQPRPGSVTLRDAQQTHKAAIDQAPLFSQADKAPRWGSSLMANKGRVFMPDGSFASAETAADSMVDASLSRQAFRQSERRLALEGGSPVGRAFAAQLARSPEALRLAEQTGRIPGQSTRIPAPNDTSDATMLSNGTKGRSTAAPSKLLEGGGNTPIKGGGN